MTLQTIDPDTVHFVDVLRELVEWWDREGRQETSATYEMAWIHGYRTIHKHEDSRLDQIVERARKLLSEE